MKHSTAAYYNAYNGVYRERRLPKSTQFVAGVYLIIIGLSVLLIGQGMRVHWGHAIIVKSTGQNSRMVAHTDTSAVQAKLAPAAPLAAPPAETNSIAAAVQTVISKPPAATWSIAVYDLDAHYWLYRTNSAAPMTAASLYKLYAVYGLSKKLPFSQWAGTQVGGRDLKSCVDLMIRMSDNTCSAALTSFVSAGAIDTAVRGASYTGTTLNPGQTNGPVTTAEDTTRFMAALYEGKLFDADTTAFLKLSLQNQLSRSAIPAGCSGCVTYNKPANESGFSHDTAIVVSGGHTYAVTIMSQGGRYYNIASVERAIQASITTFSP